ncbi:GNAT family N-acetyltransferase [Couchioplanes caeruleus]|uniref:GNAT family N-acetyltransferase n=2 Tax=Couchioplanes caeruleus TaxID=56438 RepID=A0A1K0FBJ5_9ACTN|nr:GNAT family N-acetyltransferase [Couchioplanes caeruleus]OJF10120.1 GNAT family N-acetyltransferase [Couchioplanes caeruleus subsp. caeruleus]ROP29035.1 acetyltransferase (GNAT) family protein [Couchioplanes caeruleus]
MPELIVRPMRESEFDEWNEATRKVLAASQVAIGNWSSENAPELARKARRDLLPDGLATEGMLFLKGLRPDGTPVGAAWLGLTHPRGVPDCAFLYFIHVDEAHRETGYGRALLSAAEEAALSHGMKSLELNVFGFNAPAIHLYETSGYRVVTQQMRKSLGA